MSSLFSKKLISWNYESFSKINFHLRTLIFIFALNSHLQFVLDSSNGFLWTLSADTEFPWEDRYRIKTEQPFSENVAVQRKMWNKWPFTCVVRNTKVMFATSLLKILVHVLVFQRNQKFRVIFLVFLSYNTLRAKIFGITIIVELIFAIFFLFFLLQKLDIVFYSSYVSILKNLQKTIVLSSGLYPQVFTFTIQCICNLWWTESSPLEAIPWWGVPKTRSKSTREHLTQKHDPNKADAMHLCWNHTTVWVPPPPVESPHMP